MSARILLDVNVWVALLDEAHVHNRKALALMRRPEVARRELRLDRKRRVARA